jgi:hypothetical protein
VNNVPSSFNKLTDHHQATARGHASQRDHISGPERLSLRGVARALCALCLLLAFAGVMKAIPLSAYRARVHTAADALDSLRAPADEEVSEAAHQASIAETVQQVRQSLTTIKTVEWDNTSARVDNSWLDQSLEEYDKMSESNPQRADVLLQVEERLYALDEQLAETEAGQKKGATDQGAKDEKKARLSTILRRVEYGKKDVEESALTRLRRRIMKWLDGLFPDVHPVQGINGSNIASITQIIVICLCLAGIAFVAWRYGPRIFKRTNRRRKREQRKARVVLGERLEADQTAADLLAEAEDLARLGDLRAAIRKGYIALLCELGDRKILSLAQSKTNRDYLRAVQGVEPLHTEMRRLTSVFENHWYGFAPASPSDWTNFRAGYRKAVMSDE